jgi:hypothetical protein
MGLQHQVVTKAINSLYWPVDRVRNTLTPRGLEKIRILDVGSGEGDWYEITIYLSKILNHLHSSRTVGMALEFPHCEVLGIDLIPNQRTYGVI